MSPALAMKGKKQAKPVNRRGAVPLKKEKVSKPKKKYTIKQWFLIITLFLIGLLAVDYHYFKYLTAKLYLPIRHVTINSNYYFVSEDEIKRLIKMPIGENFFLVNLQDIKSKIETIPLIDNVSIRRVWPDQIVVDIEEEMPVATWNNVGVMDNDGDIFKVKNLKSFNALPKLVGPDDSKVLVLQKYYAMSVTLQKIGLNVTKITLKPRGAWELDLTVDDINAEKVAVKLLLGRDFLDEKLKRFLAMYNAFLNKHIAKIKIVDARYTNGLAITWQMETESVAEKN